MNTATAGRGSPAPITRGMPSRATESQEMLQQGYLYAVSAAAGCNIWRAEVDDGIDAMLSHRSPTHKKDEVFLKIQMKATAAQGALTANSVKAKMSRARFNQLRDPNVTISQIVVIMHHPPAQKDWVLASEDLSVRHCAYWVSLVGLPEPGGTGSDVTVSAPRKNVFDDLALCRLMARLGQGGTP